MKTNWVNDVLDRATRTVRAWPEWMRRPEVRGIAEQPATPATAAREALDAAAAMLDRHGYTSERGNPGAAVRKLRDEQYPKSPKGP